MCNWADWIGTLLPLLYTVVGALIGLVGSFGGIFLRDWHENRRRRTQLLGALKPMIRSNLTAAQVAVGSPRRERIPLEVNQFLAIYERDLSLLGTYTHLMVMLFIAAVNSYWGDPSRSEESYDNLEEAAKSLERLIDKEQDGKRENITGKLGEPGAVP